MRQVTIVQTLVSIQGEGAGIGKPILLIRTGGCNLSCSFCDTKWANKKIKCDPFSINNTETPFILNQTNLQQYLDFIFEKFLNKYNIKTVLITGGEPFLNTDFISTFINTTNFDTYEIETNGTFSYDDEFGFIEEYSGEIQLNISPKVSQYKNKYGNDFKWLLDYLRLHKNKKMNISNSFLKFVYAKDLETDILDFIKKFKPKIPIYMSSLTPQNGSKKFLETYRKSCLDTLEFCLKTGYLYSPREHVFLFGDNREEFESLKL